MLGMLFNCQFNLPIFARRKFFLKIEEQMLQYLKFKYTKVDSTATVDLFFNTIQFLFGCCGVGNGDDFQLSKSFNRKWFSSKLMLIPPSCCKSEATNARRLKSFDYANNNDDNDDDNHPMMKCVLEKSPIYSNAQYGCVNKFFYDILPFSVTLIGIYVVNSRLKLFLKFHCKFHCCFS